MKLTVLVIFSGLLFPNLLAQNNKEIKSSLDLLYSTRLLRSSNNLKNINTFTSPQLFRPINYIGVSITGRFIVSRYFGVANHGYPIDGYIEYAQIIPQKITFIDSIEAMINGFNFGCTVAGIDLLKTKKADIITCLGFNTGRVWLNGKEGMRQKNPYFSPSLTIIPRIYIKKISLQVRFSYDYDITNKNWKRKGFQKHDLYNLGKFSNEGLNFSFGIGYIFT